MSGEGSPPEAPLDGRGLRLAIVATRWHADITDALVTSAVDAAHEAGADFDTYRVPGAVELPVVARAAAARREFDAVVCLGVVIRGDTPHFDYVCRMAADGCNRVALDYGKPVGFGVLTLDDVDHAKGRLDKGREAVRAVIETCAVLKGLA